VVVASSDGIGGNGESSLGSDVHFGLRRIYGRTPESHAPAQKTAIWLSAAWSDTRMVHSPTGSSSLYMIQKVFRRQFLCKGIAHQCLTVMKVQPGYPVTFAESDRVVQPTHS
jgi:hypothetical protein